jgi:hypothetical protein
MCPATMLKEETSRKIGKDFAEAFGIRGAGSTWQASFGMALSKADLLFPVRREPVANRIVFQVAHYIFDNWFGLRKFLRSLMPTLMARFSERSNSEPSQENFEAAIDRDLSLFSKQDEDINMQ